jgi:hypothetical protein
MKKLKNLMVLHPHCQEGEPNKIFARLRLCHVIEFGNHCTAGTSTRLHGVTTEKTTF